MKKQRGLKSNQVVLVVLVYYNQLRIFRFLTIKLVKQFVIKTYVRGITQSVNVIQKYTKCETVNV